MKNKLYKIIYICCLLIDNQSNVDIDIYETNNTIIPKEDIIIPETVINQKINIDMDLFVNSKLLFVGCYVIVGWCYVTLCVVIPIFIGEDADIWTNIFENYYNEDNNRLGTLSLFLPLIIIPILSYIVIVIINTNKYTSKYMKQNALFKSWCLYMGIMLIYLLIVTEGWTDFEKLLTNSTKFDFLQIKLKDILQIFNIFGERTFNNAPFILGMRSIVSIFVFNNIMLITSYYLFIAYKEKSDYINTLNNNITPVNVLDNNLDNIDTPTKVLDNNLI